MVDRYYLAKVAITAIVADKSFVDPNPEDPTPSSANVLPHALALVDSLVEAFGMVKSESAGESGKP